MSPVEIIFVLLGIGILIVSCFVGSKEEKTDTGIRLQEEALELQKQELKKYAEKLLKEKSEETVIKTALKQAAEGRKLWVNRSVAKGSKYTYQPKKQSKSVKNDIF